MGTVRYIKMKHVRECLQEEGSVTEGANGCIWRSTINSNRLQGPLAAWPFTTDFTQLTNLLRYTRTCVLIGVVRLPGCPFDSAWCLVCEVCRLTVDCVDCRCFLSFVFLGGASWSFLRVTHTYMSHGVATSTCSLDAATIRKHRRSGRVRKLWHLLREMAYTR